MRLIEKELNSPFWAEKGYKGIGYDRERIAEKTRKEPIWVHFGAGNIFRAFPAMLQHDLIEKGRADKGIIVGEGFDYQIIDDIYDKHDNLSLLVTLKSDGTVEKSIVASITEAYPFDRSFEKDWERFREIFISPSLQMATFTITEKGYELKNENGEYKERYREDFDRGPGECSMFLSQLLELLLARFRENALPIALVSMDNCSHNGDRLKLALTAIASKWVDKALVEREFLEYLERSVSYPWTMIDKITPRPDEAVLDILSSDGVEDMAPLVTDKGTYIAPFVNAEETGYLVMEDDFPNGRPEFERCGVYITDRETVDKAEKMKVCTCLNPIHTALSLLGCLLGYDRIYKEMRDDDIVGVLEGLGYKEALPVASDPKIIDPKAFIDQVFSLRLPNPFIPDSPWRIAQDTSQKLAIRFGETLKAYKAKGMKLGNLVFIPMVYALWLRYCLAVDDFGKAFVPAPDPLLDYIRMHLEKIKLGYDGNLDCLDDILSNERIFGLDLVKEGLSGNVKVLFGKMISKIGGVRALIHDLAFIGHI